MKKIICLLVTLVAVLSLASCAAEPSATDLSAGVFTFSNGETEITLGSEASTVLAALGEPLDYSESPSCAFEGLDKLYIYAGFRIETAPMKADGKEYLYGVELTDDSYATSKGIKIGDSKARVLEAYDGAEGYRVSEGAGEILCISSDGAYSLQFILRGENVTNIQYSVRAEK